MECKNCGTEYEGRFCPECGNECKEQGQTDCVTVCPQCGSERVGKGKFCVNCGYNYETRSSSNTATGGKINGLQSFISERKGVIYRVYRYIIAGGMLLAGVIALLCLAAPTMVEKFFGEINPLCTGFTAMIGGKGVDVPGSVVGASRALLAMSIIALIYGGVQLYWAFKRPFKTVKNYFCWALDGAIVFILLTLGAVVSAAGSSEELAGAQVGAGFAICIVMGVFGLLLLGARIFFELKLFSWADSGLSEEQIAKATEKKERKPLDKAAVKKWAKRIGIPAAIAVVLVVAIVPAVVITSNIFRIGKVDKINIGDSSDRVMEVLGEPYVKDGNFYEYYDKEYVKLSEQIKEASGIGLLAARRKDDDFDIDLDEDIDIDDGDSGADKLDKLRDKLHNLTYKYIRIEFSSDNKVTSVLFDANRCDADNSNTKKIKSYDITPESIQRYVKTDITYTVKYEDKSLLKGIAQRDVMQLFVINGYSIKCKDIYGNQLTKSVPIVDRGKPSDLEITGDVVVPDGVTALGDIFRGTKVNSVTLPTSLVRISDYAFANCSNLTTIEIPSGLEKVAGTAFEGCNNLSIYCYNDNIRQQFYKAFPIYLRNAGKVSYYAVDGVVYNLEDGEASIVRRSTTLSGSIVIPSAVIYKGTSYSVTSIGDSEFNGCSSLTSIEIPASVTSIGDSAFEGCSSLTSIEIPASVTSIGDYAFSGCSSLTIYCEASSEPSGWNSNWNSSDKPVVWNCKENDIADDGNIYYVADNGIRYALKDGGASIARQLTTGNIEIPSAVIYKGTSYSVTSIGDSAFFGCSSLTSIEIPASVTSIGSYAFSGCSSLTSIEIPAGVTSIGVSAFEDCSSLTSIEIPASVTSIGAYAFSGCSSLTSIEIPVGVTSIGDSAFEGCRNLTSIEIPASVTSIGSYAFWYCSSLTSIEIPAGVTSIGYGAFRDCSSLITIYCEASSRPSGWSSYWNSSNRPVVWNCKENDIADDGNIYYVADNGIRYALKDGGASIARQLTTLSGNIEIPSAVIYKGTSYSVTSIGSYAFYDCRNLTSIEIPASVTSIGSYAFYGCSSLTSIEIPAGVTGIGDYAFYHCSSLTSIEIPAGVTSIGSCAFDGCSSLTSIEIPVGVTSIGAYAFSGCSRLTIYCEASSKPSGWDSKWNSSNRPVVWNCKGNDIADDGNIYYVADNGIRYVLKDGGASIARQLTTLSGNIEIPSAVIYKGTSYSVTSIGDYAFYDCSSLTSIEIPASVTSIGDSAFEGCSSLTSIEIPASVTSIGDSAFRGCSLLTIYCEASSKPNGWDSYWDCYRPVVWNCKNNDIADNGNIYYVADNGIIYALKDGKAGIVRQSKTLSESIKIPSAVTYKGTSYSVTSIGYMAFDGCSSLTSIAIPASVTSIGSYAFFGCSRLTIYCEASRKPSGWEGDWNSSNRPVVWGHKISK